MGLRSTMKRAVKAGVKSAVRRVLNEPPRAERYSSTAERAPVGRAKVATPATPPVEPSVDDAPPASTRQVVKPPVQSPPKTPEERADDNDIRIKARPSRDNRQCDFLVDREVLPNLSWRFADAGAAEGSPLGEALYAHPEVAWIQIDESVVKVARRSGKEGDWRPLSVRLGATIRTHLQSGEPAVASRHFEGLPGGDELRQRIQHVIDTEVNPGVAAHEGHVTLERIRGNAVHVKMGGGCQGCSAAALTLKFGIYKAFREAVPQLGAIYDETDHAAGENPFYR